MKNRIFKSWIATFFGLLIGLLATDAYFQVVGGIREVDLITYCVLMGVTVIFIFSTNKSLLNFFKSLLDLILLKKGK